MQWELIKIEGFMDKCYRPAGEYEHSEDGYVLRLTTERVIYACEAVEMSGIKPDNVDEFYTRYLMFSRAIQKFEKKIGEIMRNKAEWRINYEREEAQKEVNDES